MSTPKGRSISGPENTRREPPAVQSPSSGPVPGPGSPFARYGPDADAMIESGEENRRQSLGVLAIVGGLVFAMFAAVVVGGVVVVSWFAWRQSQDGDGVTVVDPTDDRHVRDTGFAAPITRPPPEPVGGGTRRGGKGPVADPNVRDPSLGPPPGPVTLIVPSTMMFLTMEVSCPGGLRKRGTFRTDSSTTMRATVPDVPGDERCTVTFQGSEPARTWITGNETKTCTFNPVTCHIVR